MSKIVSISKKPEIAKVRSKPVTSFSKINSSGSSFIVNRNYHCGVDIVVNIGTTAIFCLDAGETRALFMTVNAAMRHEAGPLFSEARLGSE